MGKKKTHEEFEREVLEYGKGDYQLLSHYQNARTHVQMKHLLCTHIYTVSPKKFLEGRRCPNCSKYKQKTDDTFKEEVEQIGNGEYEILSPYGGFNKYVLMKHKVCGNEYKVRATNFLQGRRCIHCYGNPPLTHEDFLKKVKEVGGGRYEVLSTYQSSREYVKMRHLECGQEYNMRANRVSSDISCPKCALSKGEKLIDSLLKKEGLSYEREFSFPECKNKRLLRFDFCVKRPDNSILMLIEYDGIQHYEETPHFGGRKGYLRRVNNDRLKSNFAKKSEIPLLRIRYDQKNTETLITKAIEYIQNEKRLEDKRVS